MQTYGKLASIDMLRFLDIERGTVFIHGVDISIVPRDLARANMITAPRILLFLPG